ncbi:hypothetical protein OH77DRAFT_1422860 [Trametes cingulata]|nr:hypothetical protein OH77DRAFT_1422860 [Trametes cingulata]
MSSSPIFPQGNDVRDIYHDFDEDESVLPSLPPTINVVDRDVLRARRRSDKKAARILDIAIAREDFDAGDQMDTDEPGAAGPSGRRTSLSHLNLGGLSLREPDRRFATDEHMEDEAPLLNGSPSKRPRKGVAKRVMRRLFEPIRLRKASHVSKPARRAVLSSVVPADVLEDPFGDEHAMEWEDEVDTTAGGSGEGSSGSQAVSVPKTPQRPRHASAPTTPRSSPWSAKSRRSVTSWQRSPRTPSSAKSWLSEGGSPETDYSTSSGMSALRRRHARRRARQMTSQMKSLQVLGSEASEAVAKATNVKESKLRYRVWSRQTRDQLKRM